MEKTIEQKRLELLEETVKHYSKNPIERRCVKSGRCRYSPKTLNLPKSTGCAIGRKLTPKKRLELDNYYPATTVDQIYELLPKKLSDMGNFFLMKIQSLHDKDKYWDKKGLSDSGKEEVERIKNKFCK